MSSGALRSEMDKFRFLKEMGFRRCGMWILVPARGKNGKAGEMKAKYVISELEDRNTMMVLYVFIDEKNPDKTVNNILYIGYTETELWKRINAHQNPGTGKYAGGIKRNIEDLLKEGQKAGIYILPDKEIANGRLGYNGLLVNLAAGLEIALIGKINPKWNKAGISQPPAKEE